MKDTNRMTKIKEEKEKSIKYKCLGREKLCRQWRLMELTNTELIATSELPGNQCKRENTKRSCAFIILQLSKGVLDFSKHERLREFNEITLNISGAMFVFLHAYSSTFWVLWAKAISLWPLCIPWSHLIACRGETGEEEAEEDILEDW